jgi:hypothetical protein
LTCIATSGYALLNNRRTKAHAANAIAVSIDAFSRRCNGARQRAHCLRPLAGVAARRCAKSQAGQTITNGMQRSQS